MQNECLEKFLQDNNFVSYMNNTKWERLVEFMEEQIHFTPQNKPLYLSYSCKCLNEEYNANSAEIDWKYHLPFPRKHIEFIEFNPVISYRVGHITKEKNLDLTDFYINNLLKMGIPISMHNGIIKIWGHKAAGEQVAFLQQPRVT
jgi:hypothetical protein